MSESSKSALAGDAPWKLPAIGSGNCACLNCEPKPATADMEMLIAVGFGDAHVSRDGEEVYREPSPYFNREECNDCNGAGRVGQPEGGWKGPSVEPFSARWDALPRCERCEGNGTYRLDPSLPDLEYWQFLDAENAAAADPDHDWRVVLDGPLSGVTYQRHGPEEWVIVAKNGGFA